MDMKDFLKVTDLKQVLEYARLFPVVATETVPLNDALGRIIAERIDSDVDLPDFARATMDGYAVKAASTFGTSEANPVYLNLKGTIAMGEAPEFSIAAGEAARIYTGGMLPAGADGVVMIEHTELLDPTTIEVYRSVAPGQHMVAVGEDFARGEAALLPGREIRPQEAGLLAAFGRESVTVFRKPVLAIISTGDEVVPLNQTPGPGQIRDINTHTLAGQVRQAGGLPVCLGIVNDAIDDLKQTCHRALQQADMILISGGSSMGARDFTIEVLSSLPDAEILVHGIPISPGKPTILARSGNLPIWGLPGHVVSAMVVFTAVVRPFVQHISGRSARVAIHPLKAVLTRNVASAQGRVDYVRVMLRSEGGVLHAEPILGKSALIHTMVKADGTIAIGENTEGLDKGEAVEVFPF
jgi:molybdopterin molybdotransferase